MAWLLPGSVKNFIKKKLVGLHRKLQEWDKSEYVYEQNWLLELEGKATPEKLEQLNGRHFMQVHGYPIHWDEPKSFSEKIMWMSLYYQNPLRICSNKFKVKGYVEAVLGPGYTLPVIDWWTDPDDIDFEKLPNKFVLKVNNSTGHNIFVPDKRKINEQEIRRKLRLWMHPANNGYYWIYSWAAKWSSPLIYAEDYLIPEGEVDSLCNYKLSCFNGACKNIFLFSKREMDAGCVPAWVDRDFNELPFTIGKGQKKAAIPPKPECLSEMIRISEKLAKPFPYLRVDLYEVNGRIFVGELTFSFANGLAAFDPDSYDFMLGDEIELPERMDVDRLRESDPLPAQQAYLLDGKLPPETTRRCLERKAFTSLFYWPDLEHPRSLNEKLLWTALNWKSPLTSVLADRYETKRFIAKTVGERYVVPTIGVYVDTGQIDWDALPERFVAKSTANRGKEYLYLVRRKTSDNEGVFKATVGDWLLPWNTWYCQNACLAGRRAEPRILIEELLESKARRLNEYRFYCSQGNVKLICAVCEQTTERESFTYLAPEGWETLPVRRWQKHKRPMTPRPEKLEEMLALCGRLSEGFPLVRIDCFETEGRVYVNGMSCDMDLFQRLEPVEWDYKLGERFEIGLDAISTAP